MWSHLLLAALIVGAAYRLEKKMNEFDKVLEKVTGLETANDSIIALVKGLGDIIRSNVDNRAGLLSLADRLDADTAKVVTAVNEGTPVTPPAPTPTPAAST